MPIPEPRHYGVGDLTSPLLQLANEGRDLELVNALRNLAASGQDAEIAAALSAVPSQRIYARLWNALCAAIEKAPADDGPAPRVFAIPWVIVCGSTARAMLSCVLPD